MLIICPACVSTYRLPAEAARSNAGSVRCAQCASIFDPAAARIASSAVMPLRSPFAFEPAPLGLLREPAFRTAAPIDIESRTAARSRVAVIALIVTILGLNMAGVAFRTRIAEVVPAMEPVYAAIGLPTGPVLRLDGVETTVADEGAGKVLAVQGRIANAGPTQTTVPNLRIVVRDEAEQSIYSWTTPAPQPRLAPGEVVDFRSRLVAPPSAGHDVVVSFAGPSDIGSAAGF